VEINAAIKPVLPRLRGLLLGAQVTAVIVLLSAAWGLASGVRKSKMADLGFEAKDVYMAMFIYSSDAVDPKTANRRLRERFASLARVDSVTIGDAPQGGEQAKRIPLPSCSSGSSDRARCCPGRSPLSLLASH